MNWLFHFSVQKFQKINNVIYNTNYIKMFYITHIYNTLFNHNKNKQKSKNKGKYVQNTFRLKNIKFESIFLS